MCLYYELPAKLPVSNLWLVPGLVPYPIKILGTRRRNVAMSENLTALRFGGAAHSVLTFSFRVRAGRL